MRNTKLLKLICHIGLSLMVVTEWCQNFKKYIIIIPEQFTAIGPPSFIWRGGAKKFVVEHFPEASAGGLFVRRFRRRFLPEEVSSAGDLLWRPTLPKRIWIRIRILIYLFLKYWGSLISDENSSGRSLWKVFHNFLRIIFAQKCSTIF